MKRSVIVLAILAAGLAACKKNSTTSPSSDNQAKFTALLSPADELPAVTDAEGNGSGSVTITLNLTRDSGGTITAATADFSATFSGFPAGTALTGAHVHPGFAGTSGGVAISTGITAGEITMPSGSGSLTKNGITVSADTATKMISSPAGYYFNIHTAAHPSGVARGQLTRIE